jgi:hypothetical protein
MQRRFYLLWLAAAALAAVGAATDTSWHFAHLFDSISVPHMILVSGIVLYVALLFWALSPWALRLGCTARVEPDAPGQGGRGWTLTLDILPCERVRGPERTALWIAAAGIGLFIVAIPLDLIWHSIFGVDITTWSPTHLSLNYTSDIAHVGILAAWLASPSVRARGGRLVTYLFAVATLLAVHYPLYQQEYGAIATDGLLRSGHAPWYVDPNMWVLAGPQALHLIKGGAPDWLYLVYTALCVSYTLTLGAAVLYAGSPPARGRRPDAGGWTWRFGAATAIALGFVVLRLAFATAFGLLGMPVAVTPWYLVAMGIAIDVVLLVGGVVAARLSQPSARHGTTKGTPTGRPVPLAVAALGGALAALALYGGMQVMRSAHVIVPMAPGDAVPLACLAGAAGAMLGAWLAAWMRRRLEPAPHRAESSTTLAPRLERFLASAVGRRGR